MIGYPDTINGTTSNETSTPMLSREDVKPVIDPAHLAAKNRYAKLHAKNPTQANAWRDKQNYAHKKNGYYLDKIK